MEKIITGVKPTGAGLHFGNYFGAIKPFIERSKGKEAYLFIADYHSLTSVHNSDILIKNKQNIILEYFALLPEDTSITIFEQSKISHINDISWILSSLTPLSLMMRAHSYKDAQAKGIAINMATFNYPILMSADILTYDIDSVPVGKDQIQHLEFARDIAGYFNKNYKKDLFKLPKPYIEDSSKIIPGTDGRKMSKSYNNFIGIFDDDKTLKKKIMSIPTDTKTLEDSKNPDECKIFELIKLFANSSEISTIRAKYINGGYGYGHAKLALIELIKKYVKPFKDRKEWLKNNQEYIFQKLKEGNEKANNLATKKYKNLIKTIGL